MILFEYDNDRHINLENVSSVKLDQSKIIFNLDHTVVTNNKILPEYIYCKLDRFESLDSIEYFRNNFVEFATDAFVNIKKVSYVVYEEDLRRITFTLNNNHSYVIKGMPKVVSEFKYMNDVPRERYEQILKLMMTA